MSGDGQVIRFPAAGKAPARPVLAASIAVFRDGKVLLATRTKPPADQLWSLPGGKVEAGETLEEAALRELDEEVGVTARILGFNRHVEIFGRDAEGAVTHHFVVASFIGEWLSGEPRTGPANPARDTWELALVQAALAEGTLPLLGICRGMQVLNVALGGTLVQHIDGHAAAPAVVTPHPVQPVAGTRYAAIAPEPCDVHTYHHQAVRHLGHGLVPVAWAGDEVVEAVEVRGHRFGLGVQWHPEEGDDLRLFEALAEAAAK